MPDQCAFFYKDPALVLHGDADIDIYAVLKDDVGAKVGTEWRYDPDVGRYFPAGQFFTEVMELLRGVIVIAPLIRHAEAASRHES